MQIAAKTPRSNCVLDTIKSESVGLRMRPVEDALELAMQRWSLIPQASSVHALNLVTN
jgi:hypothetical protein